MSKDYAILASGCFWCTETIFDNVNGVLSVVPGYIGGSTENPTYEQVCSGTTGHAEAVKIEYDSNIISFDELLEVFFKTHDPTTLNRQGNDVGTQYRSAIFYKNDSILSFHNKFSKLIFSKAIQNRLSKKIFLRSKKFSDHEMAKKTFEFLINIAKKN